MKNYAPIDRAPVARSKSDEFFVWNPIVIEQGLILCLKPPKPCCTFWDPESVCYVASLGHCIDVDVMLLCLYARVHLIPGLRVEHQPEQDVLSCSVIVASL